MRRRPPRWPGWVEPLRPDETVRARMRTAILARAAPLLDARRAAGSWQEVAAGWSGMLVPIAAVLVLFFGGLAYQATPRTVQASPVTLEDLLRDDETENALAVLATGIDPSPDWALTTVIRHQDGTPPAEEPGNR